MFIQTGIKIDGTDITKYIAHQGVSWKRNDVDGPNTGRTMSGLMVRDRVATKIRLDITCTVMTYEELQMILNLIYPVFVQVTYDDPQFGPVTKTMYSNNNEAQIYKMSQAKYTDEQWYMPGYSDPETKEYWQGIKFPLIER